MTPRQIDDRDLEWLALRRAGMSAVDIADHFGVTKETVKVRTLAVRAADFAEAAYWGDDPKQIGRSYWNSAEARNSGRIMTLSGIRKNGLRRKP